MYRFKIRVVFSVEGAGRKTEATNAATGSISENVVMLVGEHDHIERLRCSNHTSCQVIDQKLLVTQTGIAANSLSYQCTEAPIRAWQYRVFSSKGHTTGVSRRLATPLYSTRRQCYTRYILIRETQND